ncbi:MAG: DUF192 domain-containing protein [Kiritimatiellae bacterium]|jgi:uncharacterized membrane protein (UPF0127 family)|nr:DUF192 domain-containing protein [Kiritimatiellia bacterium]
MQYGILMLEGALFAEPVEYVVGFFERLKGLLVRNGLKKGAAMVIEHCSSVHTVGMRFPIDLIFLDKEWRIISVKRDVKPGRPMLSGGWHAKRVVESQAGGLDLEQLKVGDKLEFITN